MVFVTVRAITYATLFIGFFLIAMPARLLVWSGLSSPETTGWPQMIGVAFTAAGAALTLWCVATFVFVGRGTPFPLDPPRRLVDRGPYAIVRNPMSSAAALGMGGAALAYGSWVLLIYVVIFLAVMHAVVVGYEEPTLRSMFGPAYEDYCRRVNRWI
jgi:protein-S-isoprenylcysteine O-methyltransferase Ste14